MVTENSEPAEKIRSHEQKLATDAVLSVVEGEHREPREIINSKS